METDQPCAGLADPINLGGVPRGADLVGSEFEEDGRSAPVLDQDFRLIDKIVFTEGQGNCFCRSEGAQTGPSGRAVPILLLRLSYVGCLILDVGNDRSRYIQFSSMY